MYKPKDMTKAQAIVEIIVYNLFILLAIWASGYYFHQAIVGTLCFIGVQLVGIKVHLRRLNP